MSRISKRLNEYLGREFDTTKSGKCFIINYEGNRKVTVMVGGVMRWSGLRRIGIVWSG